MFYSKICDKNCEELDVGDKVLLFGEIGEVIYDSGAYGIYFKEGVPWKLIEDRFYEFVSNYPDSKEKSPKFCYYDKIVSFWELMRNFDCIVEDVCDVVEKMYVA